jgi:hypothetical protein
MVTGIEFVGPVASPVFKAVIEVASARLKKISDDKASSAIAALTYLETADEIMTALEAEADQLIVTAAHLASAPDVAVERAAVFRRLDSLLYGEIMRPALINLHEKLKVCRTELERDSKRFFGKLSPKHAKQEVLNSLDVELRNFELYLDQLTTETPGYYQSAPYITQLMDLRTELESGRDPQDIANKARTVLSSRVPMAVRRSAQIGELTERIRSQLG